MKICEFYKEDAPVLSLEIFPPKKNYPLDTVFETIGELRVLNPKFISVTYGAGGSSRGRTVEIASRIKKDYKIEPLAHLTCVSHTRKEVEEILNQLIKEDIHNILALRGDPPDDDPDFDYSNQEYRYAYELIRDAKRVYDFGIAAAAYPEGHRECKRLSEDLKYLKQKVDEGVDFLITQMFFDNRLFYDFMDKAAALNISCPIVPGIMPVLNSKQVRRMIYLSGGASIPSKLLALVEKYSRKTDDMEKAGIDYASEQISDLLENKVCGVHLYTMNKSKQIAQIVKNVGLA
ncbi:methylenetetrahydrofolate reductase [NAD(P)H] [Thermosyntropha sp.]|uniref:methylenetetrahydrofolate reductase [NAD(P)H] n=1 Tax=Thermosyntropha sp. TaxID=2740820 RepID=UPI0025EAEF63|nr:methylenetetrahydrofolate reductase [NAD(P)H] [Thermosyntropha sp.]MBO8158726.1 methylenetetrahydrofolate reductase [NAD(P)H] [Thermosyntropha sp.]